MKRASEIVYTYLDRNPTEFHLTPKFNFSEDSGIPRLVDYSFTDVSDSDDDDATVSCQNVDRLQKLQSDLFILKSKLSRAQCYRRSQVLHTRQGRHLRIRASRRLKVEEDKEKVRNSYVLQRLNDAFSEASDSTLGKLKTNGDKSSCNVYDTDRPCKKRKLDLNMLKRFTRKSFLKRSKRRQNLISDKENITYSGCLFGFLKVKRCEEEIQ